MNVPYKNDDEFVRGQKTKLILIAIGIVVIMLSSCGNKTGFTRRTCVTNADMSHYEGKTITSIRKNVDKRWDSRLENMVITFDDGSQIKVESGTVGHLMIEEL
jgi:hypothetical protein